MLSAVAHTIEDVHNLFPPLCIIDEIEDSITYLSLSLSLFDR